ncbi:MAG: DUF2064 domain-containing protein [Saprospiraceae bacterium]
MRIGYQAVICIGNDSPQLAEVVNWQQVATQLASGRCVIGPSHRGGAYLIGITATRFCPQRFQQLPWQSRQLLSRLQDYCRDTTLEPALLAPLADINSKAELIAYIKANHHTDPLWRTLWRILHPLSPPCPVHPAFFTHPTPFIPCGLRAPPLPIG